MTTASFMYLFDVDKFKTVITPVVQKLEKNDCSLLQMNATEAGYQNPQIWAILNNFRYYFDDLGHEEDEFPDPSDRANFWMMILLASFLQLIEDHPYYNSSNISKVLQASGWEARDIQRLLIGNSQRALLQPQLVHDLVERPIQYSNWPFWCQFGRIPALTGWLSFSDIQELLPKLFLVKEKIEQVNHPQLAIDYNYLVKILSIADRTSNGLFFAVAD